MAEFAFVPHHAVKISILTEAENPPFHMRRMLPFVQLTLPTFMRQSLPTIEVHVRYVLISAPGMDSLHGPCLKTFTRFSAPIRRQA